MGGLHQGHAQLIQRAVAGCPELGSVLVSVYVNPLQFEEGEDFDRYPRSFEADCLLAQQAGASAIWCPDERQIYPQGVASGWKLQAPSALQSGLCGPWRPGHFDGVATMPTPSIATQVWAKR